MNSVLPELLVRKDTVLVKNGSTPHSPARLAVLLFLTIDIVLQCDDIAAGLIFSSLPAVHSRFHTKAHHAHCACRFLHATHPQLDGVRGLAILLVLIWHYAVAPLQPSVGTWAPLFKTTLGFTWSGAESAAARGSVGGRPCLAPGLDVDAGCGTIIVALF